MLKGRKGFTLVELVVALTLFGVCAAGVARLLTHFQRHHLRQVEQAEVRATLQTSAWLISRDLRELDVTDPLGSDLVAVSDSSLTYKAMRGVHFTCLPSALANPVVDSSALGLREADAQYDSVLVLATVAQGRESTDRWIHADLIGASAGSPCPGGRPGVQLALGVPEPGDSIPAGTPVRFFEMVQ
ncbi:MAG TPA: prepilin-type N-terminal cleavage/methylation domain-containing protein, partial [Gemmatimonadales bacterium]|nr:prepilin-type N-terminal cleavage/methylation domain-containing protein [Gemmatimonadales bacterium]